MASKLGKEAVEECKRIGKPNYILKLQRKQILKQLKDVDVISRQLNLRGVLTDQESQQISSQTEGSTYSAEEVLIDILYTKQTDDVATFWNLLRETKQYQLTAAIEEIDRDLELLLQDDGGKDKTQYSLPAKVVLPSSEEQSENINVNQFKADVIATKDGVIRLIKRNVWGASPSKGQMSRLKHPAEYVIISHTASIGSYMTTLECAQACKQAQDLNMGWGWSDIAYNFLIGNDGAMYEGRGWDYQSATAKGWNNRSIGMAFIGKYVDRLPSDDALDVTKSFLQYLVDSGVLSKDFTIHCLRQVRDLFPDSPGDRLYAKIQAWHGKGPNTWSWRELEEIEDQEAEPTKEEQLSEKLKMELGKEVDTLCLKINTPELVLRYLADKDVFTKNKQQKILKKSRSDEELMNNVLQHLIAGKKQWFTTFLEALLTTHNRLLAKTLWKIVPCEDKSVIQKPSLKAGVQPVFKDIALEQISFDKPYNNSKKDVVELGAGSFGVVILASYMELGGAKVAVKRIKGSEHGGMNGRDLSDFKKEARTMYSLRHPDIVTIYGTICDTVEHVYGIVMEYMEVGSLDDLMSKVVIPWPVKVRMLRDVCRGLVFLNTPQPDRQYTVTHCDIKAKNILLNDRFSAKIADFGEAVLQNITTRSTGGKSLSSDRNHGTVTHMAPDLLTPDDGDSYDPTEKTDVWSFGITAFEVCAENSKGTAERRTPFPKKMKQIQITHMIGVLKQCPFNEHEMEKVPKDCPDFLVALMKRCCEVDKQKRLLFKDALEILENNYQEHFKLQIHKSLIELHKIYANDVLMMNLTINDDDDDVIEDEDLTYSSNSGEDTATTSSNGNAKTPRSKHPSRKSRVKELEELRDRFASLERQVSVQSVDISSLSTNVNDISEAKLALIKERQLVKDTGERDLLTPLEEKISVMETTVKKQIDDAKDEILTFTEKSGRDRGQELEQLEERLTKHLLRLTTEDAAVRNHEFADSCIRQNFTHLVEDIDPEEVMDYLYQELFTFDEYERVRNQQTKRDKNRMILVYVDRKGKEGVSVLRTALQRVEYLQDLCKYLGSD